MEKKEKREGGRETGKRRKRGERKRRERERERASQTERERERASQTERERERASQTDGCWGGVLRYCFILCDVTCSLFAREEATLVVPWLKADMFFPRPGRGETDRAAMSRTH